jgi:hypothetical protein
MSVKRRICRLSDGRHKDVDLRKYEKLILDTIEQTVPGKNPEVHRSYFSTDPLNHSEVIKLGRALAKIEELAIYGKEVTIFRLFEGHIQETEEPSKIKGGRMK